MKKILLIFICLFSISNEVSAQLTAAFTINSSNDPSIEFTDQSVGTVPGVLPVSTWDWDMGDGTTYSYDQFTVPPSVIHTYTSNGIYNVCLTVTDIPTQSDMDCQTVTISGVVPPPTQWTIGDLTYTVITGTTNVSVTKASTGCPTGALVIPATTMQPVSNISHSVTFIEDYAFYFCTGLTSISIPNSVTSIGTLAFGYCSGLTSLSIPNSVTSIGNNAFSYCSGLTSVSIGNSVSSIGFGTFQSCSGLTSVSIPNSVISIGEQAFSNCTGLTSVIIGNSVTTIGIYAFQNCTGLASVSIPNSVTTIGNYAFRSCTGLASVSVNWITPLTINANVFLNVTIANIPLTVPAGTEAAYGMAAVWEDFAPLCTDPTVPTISSSSVCNGSSATLTITGTLNDATAWHVYTSSCGGTSVGTTTTGTFTTAALTANTTFYVRGEGGCVTPGSCASVAVNVTALDDASFSYNAATYCNTDADPTPTITGLAGGSFSSGVPYGFMLNNATGEIDLANSMTGIYTVTYTTNGTCPNTATAPVEIMAACAPVNDDISGAIAVACGSVTSGTSVNATIGIDEGTTCGTPQTEGGVWYSFVGTGDYIQALTCSFASYDTKISVFTGVSGSLICEGGNDDACGTLSGVGFYSTAGTTYYILVHGFLTSGTFDLTIECWDLWTGATSTDWNTSSNWNSGTTPTSSSELIYIQDVSGASNNYPIMASATSVNVLFVAQNASLTINTGVTIVSGIVNEGTVTLKDGAYLDDFTNSSASFVGDITIERLVSNGAGNDQRFISSAVNTPNVSEIGDDLVGPWGTGLPGVNGVAVTIDNCALQTTTSGSNYGNLFEINETLVATCALDAWVVRSSGTLTNGAGYSAYLPSGSTFELSGTPNSGSISVALTNSGSGVAAGEGWNLMGNPYPSPISRDDVINAGVTDAQYYEASGPYQGTFTPYMPTSNIAIAQGFQVQTAATGSITFTDAMRNTGASTWYNNSPWFEHKLEVIVSGNNFADKTILFYNNDATVNYEAIYDVSKRPSALGQPTLSSFLANKELALNGMPVNSLGETVPMHFDAGTNGTFTLSFEGMETFGNTSIYVKDLQENVVHNIEVGDYSFASTTTDNAGRFEIIFVPEVEFTATLVDCEMNDASLSLVNLDFIANRTFEISNNASVLNSGDLADLNTVELQAGNYTLNVADQFGGSQVYDIIIESAEMIEAELEVSNTEVFVGEMISLNNTTSNATAVIWSTENSTIGSVNNLTYSFNQAGTYEIEMMVSNAECSDMKTVVIEVTNKTTAIETIDGQKINFYPNPATDVLHIESDVNVVIEMIDILGKTLITTSNKQINLENIPTGVYFLKIYNENNKLIGSEKVIKK